MDDKIYPLKIGEGAPIPIRPRDKKPQVKANLKERKKLIVIVAAVAALAIGSVIYLSGMGGLLKGFTAMTPIVTMQATPAGGQNIGIESSFVLSLSVAPQGDVLYGYGIDFGDGTDSLSCNENQEECETPDKMFTFKHTYTDSGTYKVRTRIDAYDADDYGTLLGSWLGEIDYTITTTPEWESAQDLIITGSIVGDSQVEYGEGVTLDISANRDSTIKKIEIYSITGALKKELTDPKNLDWDGSSKQITWDGKDEGGQYVNSGSYKFKISAEYSQANPAAPYPFQKAQEADVLFNIIPGAQVLELSAGYPTGETGKEVSFSLSMNGGSYSSYPYSISYGDGNSEGPIQSNTSSSYLFKHTYQNNGTYPVVARMSTSGGIVIESETYYYTITDPQAAPDTPDPGTPGLSLSLSASPSLSQNEGEEVVFTLTKTGGTEPYEYNMYYGDGTPHDEQTISTDEATFTHTYAEEGNFTAQGYIINSANDYKLSNEIAYTITAAPDTPPDIPDAPDPQDTPDPETPDPPATYQCSNDADDDGDGKVDYPNDTGCSSATDDTENSEGTGNQNNPDPPSPTQKETKCNDGKDNDDDGEIDYEDSDCEVPSSASIEITDVGVTSPTFNPIIGATKIYYKLSDTANTKVKIINASGSELVTLFDGKQEKQSGSFSIWWEGTLDNSPTGQKVPNGTYTYKIEATHSKYPTVKDSKQGSIIVDSAYNPGGLDFEDPQAPQANQYIQTPQQQIQISQNQATQALQNSATGNTAGTGPEVIFYFLFPALAFACQKISKNK